MHVDTNACYDTFCFALMIYFRLLFLSFVQFCFVSMNQLISCSCYCILQQTDGLNTQYIPIQIQVRNQGKRACCINAVVSGSPNNKFIF